MKNKTADLVIQIISVTVGVFLGFMISNWSEGRREADKYNALIKNITAEIQDNQKKIEQVINYHRTVRDSTRFYLKQEDLKQFSPDFFKGVRTLTLVNSAYQTGIQTGLFNNMKLEKIQSINDIYTKQRAYEDFSNLLLSGLITMDFEESEKSTRKLFTFLSISMTDIVYKEEELLQSYDNSLTLITE